MVHKWTGPVNRGNVYVRYIRALQVCYVFLNTWLAFIIYLKPELQDSKDED